MKRRMKRKEETAVQNSIYYATENAIEAQDIKDKLVYQKIENAEGYDEAVSILARIRWGPGVIYKEELFPADRGNNIKWEKIW